MTKMTVLYAVFVALLFLVARTPAHPHRGGERTGRAARRHGDRPRRAAGGRGRSGAAVARRGVGLLAALVEHRRWAARRRLARLRRLVGGHRPGGGQASRRWRASSRRARAPAPRIAGGGIGVLFLVRAVGDTSASVAELALAVRLVDPAACLVGPAVVGAAALRRSRSSDSSRLAQVLRGAPRPGIRDARGPARAGDRITAAGRRHRAEHPAARADARSAGPSRWPSWAWCSASIAPNIGSTCSTPRAARDMMERLGGQGALRGHVDRRRAARWSPWWSPASRSPSSGHGGADEHDGRTEQVLATATSRSRSFAGHPGGRAGRGDLAAARDRVWRSPSAYGTASGDPGGTFGGIVAAALAQAPAVWLVHGDRRGGVLLAEPVGGARLGLPGALPDARPARRAAAAAAVGDRPVAVRARAEDAGRVLRGRPLVLLTASGGGAARAGLAALPDARHRLTRCRTALPISPTRPPCSVRGAWLAVIDDRQAGVESRVDGRLLLTAGRARPHPVGGVRSVAPADRRRGRTPCPVARTGGGGELVGPVRGRHGLPPVVTRRGGDPSVQPGHLRGAGGRRG